MGALLGTGKPEQLALISADPQSFALPVMAI